MRGNLNLFRFWIDLPRDRTKILVKGNEPNHTPNHRGAEVMAKLQLTREQAEQLMYACGYSAAEKWNDSRMQKRLLELGTLVDPDKPPEDEEMAALLKQVIKAGDNVELVTDEAADEVDEDAAEDADEAEETEDTDDEEESEEAEEEPAPKAKKKGGKKATKEEKPAKAKKEKPAKPAAEKKPRQPGMLEAAAKVLKANKNKPMRTKEMIEKMAAKGLWTSPGGKTPHATLYSRLIKEEEKRGKESRFKRVDAGQFALTKVGLGE